ncbi:polyamine ABC transporter substrate-binding protein [Pararhodobacter sp.]|uniref:polyamine ABC transporter substrate-binding protein n=1 Tax=Pararhodobacter sp. TaxID=2127056 RepID=UPI002AFF4561|nr:polyamine ABC transporter substrate-binding protein [Pararhodobacter sp.]
MKRSTLAATLACLALPAPALAEGSLHLYIWSDYITDAAIDRFRAETGIDVSVDVYDSNETLEARLLAGASGYDVVVPTADFLQRQVAAGVYAPLDRAQLPNWSNMDEGLMSRAASFDPGNEHGTIYMWGTTGIGYNIDMIAERLGADYEVNSLELLFDPEIASKVADCGITMLDAPVEMIPAALAYLGRDPQSHAPEDLEAAGDLLTQARENVRYFHSSQYIGDLANGEVCVAFGYSGDVFQAAARAEEADRGVNVWYAIPEEGAVVWFDLLAIPADAPNPENAHRFINYLMQPDVIAEITNYVWYANANRPSWPLVDPQITSDPAIFPTQEVMDRLFTLVPYDSRTDRIATRLWTRVRTGQ